jgi:hypothetical protein
LRKLSEKTGKSERELASEAILAYYRGLSEDKDIKSITPLRPIVLKFSAKCYMCKAELKQGELAYHQKIVYTDNSTRGLVLCANCASQEDVLAKRYVKLYELKKIINGLEKQAKQLAEEILQLEKLKPLTSLYIEIEKEIRTLLQFFKTYQYPKEVVERLEEINTKLATLTNNLEEALEAVRELVIPKVRARVR